MPIRGLIVLTSLLIGAPLAAQPNTATINMQEAVIRCQEGVRAAAQMKAKFEQPMAALDQRDKDIRAERVALENESQIRHGMWPFRRHMSAKEKARRSHAIDDKAMAVAQERASIATKIEADERKLIGEIADRMIPLVKSYANDHGYSMVLDSGQMNGPVVVALNDITDQIVSLFNHKFPTSSN